MDFGRTWLDLHLELGLWFHSADHIAIRQSRFYFFSHLGRPIRAKGSCASRSLRKPGFWVRVLVLNLTLGGVDILGDTRPTELYPLVIYLLVLIELVELRGVKLLRIGS